MRILSSGWIATLLIGGWFPSPATASPLPINEPFLIGGIQVNEGDHERWSAALLRAGANAVEVTVYAQQGAWNTSDLWFEQEEPAVLAEIRSARRNGLQVVLILRVALDHNDPANRFLWHGLIYPETDAELAEWFRRYGAFVQKWARLAAAEGVEVFGIASEMNSLMATLPVEEIPNLPAFYLDDAKQLELKELINRYGEGLDERDRIGFGAGDFASLEEFLSERNRFERRWARSYTFAPPNGGGLELEQRRVKSINERRQRLEQHWRALIGRVRKVYDGPLTLAANFDNYHEVSFWEDLDFIGINAYFPLRSSLEEPLEATRLRQSWRRVFQDIDAFRQAREVPHGVLFTELGYTQRQGVTVAPWSSSGLVPMWDDVRGNSVMSWSRQPMDPAERALAVSSLYEVWVEDDVPLEGILYWKLSSRAELARYEPFMLHLGPDTKDPLYSAFERFAEKSQPLIPGSAGSVYQLWVAALTRGELEGVVGLGPSDRVEVPSGELPLLHLALQRKANPEVVRRLIGQGADLMARDSNGYLPLHWSCYQADASLVVDLIPPPGISWQDEMNETPFHKCARLDNTAVMAELLRFELREAPDENAAHAGPRPSSPLRLAADQASVEMVELLLEHGGRADAVDGTGMTPLHSAARRGDAAIVERMLQRVDKGLQDGSGHRAVDYAAYYGNAEAFRVLWEPRAAGQHNNAGQTLLHLAAHGGNVEILEVLLSTALDVNDADESGRTPLHFAVMKAHRAATQLLLERGAEIERADQEGRSAIHLAAELVDERVLGLVLEASESTVNARDAAGNTPLHFAAGWGRVENVRRLLKVGARQDARTKAGRTALEVAEESGRKRVVLLLQEWAREHRDD